MPLPDMASLQEVSDPGEQSATPDFASLEPLVEGKPDISPYDLLKSQGVPDPYANTTDLIQGIARDPAFGISKDSPLSIPMAPLTVAGNVLRAAVSDAGATFTGHPEYGGNLYAVANEQPQPEDVMLSQMAKQNPIVATAGKTVQDLIGTAPMMALGAPEGLAGKLMSIGFAADMGEGVKDAAKSLGEEMAKNPEDRDADKVTSAVSGLLQSSVFATAAGLHGLKPSDKTLATTQLAAQLLKEPTFTPGEKQAPPAIVENAPATADAILDQKTAADMPTTFAPGETKPPEIETEPPVSETVQAPAETVEEPAKSPVEALGEGIDFSTIQKPHLVGVEAGLNLTPEDVPAIKALQKQSVKAMVDAAQSGDNNAYQSIMGKNSFLGGVIEGALKKGPNYDVYQELKSSPPPEQPITAPAAPQAELEAQAPEVPAVGEVEKPTTLIKPPAVTGNPVTMDPRIVRPIPTISEAKASNPNLSPGAVGAIHEWETNQKIIDTGIGADGGKLSKQHLEELVARQPKVIENYNQEVIYSDQKLLTQGDAIEAVLPSGVKVSGHVIGADEAGNSVVLQPDGKTVTLPEKLTDTDYENTKPVVLEGAPTPPPKAVENVTGKNAGEIQLPAAEKPGEGAGLPGNEVEANPAIETAGTAGDIEAEPALVGMGAAVPSEFRAVNQSTTSIKNAIVERERAERGLPPAIEPAKRGFGRVWDEAMAKIDQDPSVQDNLVSELKARPRAVTDLENALLLHRQIELQNQYGKLTQEMADAHDDSKEFPNRLDDVEELKPRVADVTDQLFDLYEINKKVGTETGRGLNARKMMAYEDYTLAKMELDARAANGGRPLTDEEKSKVGELHDRIEKLRKDYDEYTANSQSRISELESEKALNEIRLKSEPPIEPHIRTLAEKIVSKIETEGKSARERIKSRRGRLMAGLDPTDLVDHAIVGAEILTKGAVKFADWSAAMVKDLGEYVKPHLKQIFSASNRYLESQINKSSSPYTAVKLRKSVKSLPLEERQIRIRGIIKKRLEEGKRDEVSSSVKAYARLLVEQGVKSRDDLISKVHDYLNSIDPSITRREAMDAISGYGIFSPLPKDVVSKELRDLKGQMQQVAKLEDMQKGQPPLKTGIERRTPSLEESRLIKLVNEAKQKFQIPITDPSRQLKSALDTLKTRMLNRIQELSNKIKEGDFGPARKPDPLKLDSNALVIKANYERAKLEFERQLQQYRLRNRTSVEKVADTLVKWRRGFLLSSPVTLAKLTSAAIQRLTITPAEEAIGGAISAAIPKVAAKAQREGGFNTKAEAKAITEAFTKGMNDAAETIRTGASPLDVLYGQGREGYVRESMSLPRSVIDFFGNLHAALKAPVKRAEFARAFEKRVSAAIHDGVDVSDPMVQTRLSVESYKDANRSIFLQDNRLVNFFKAGFRALEQPNKETGKPTVGGKLAATAGRLALPILRVPTNIVAETFTYAFGSLAGGLRLANAFAKGFENLQPQEADLIMRELKKGSLGAAVMLLGYFNASNIGGYYQPGQKRDPKDVKFGDVRLFGHEIPSFLVHNPLLEVLQLGATIRRVADAKVKGQTKGLWSGLMAGALGLTEEIPFVREMFGELPKMFNPSEQSSFTGELAKSIFVPQLLQWLATATDKDQAGNTVPRSPQTFMQHIETGLPGLRNTVPKKK